MLIRTAIIDNHPVTIHGVQSMLQPYEHIQLIDTYTSARALLEGLKERQPDVLLLDIMLPESSGRELAEIISAQWPGVRMLALTSLDAPSHVKSMMRRGCAGYLLKDTDAETLAQAIQQVYEGKEFIEPVIKEQILQNVLKYRKNNADAFPKLTQREKEILTLIVQEHTSQEIADKLFISLRTVETHRFSLLQKLDAKNMVALTKIAMQMGLVE
jgi:DNA-binding NarL/FixJ family response regulator